LLPILALLLVAGSAVADDCREMPSTSATQNCRASALADAEQKKVDAAYKKLLGLLEAKDRKWPQYVIADRHYVQTLEASQAAWAAYIDVQCELEGMEFLGGTGQDGRAAECVERLSRTRLGQLTEMLRECDGN